MCKMVLTPEEPVIENLDILQIPLKRKRDALKIQKPSHQTKEKKVDKLTFASLNINSLPNKFSSLAEIVSNNIDVLS